MLNNKIVGYSVFFFLLILLQVAILNKITFLDFATPFVYIYFILKLPVSMNRNIVLILGFLLGFIIDIFCNTLGINAAATTFIAFISQPAQKLFFQFDDYFEDQKPNLSALGFKFVKYAMLIISIHHIILISLESFSYLNIELILLRILLSILLSSVLIFAFEGFSFKKKDRDKQ